MDDDDKQPLPLWTNPAELMPGEGVTFLVDHYNVMGLKSDADEAAIHAAWRALQKDYHPDRYEHLASDMQAQATHKLARIRRSYDVLSSPEARELYDAHLKDWDGPISSDGVQIIVISRRGALAQAQLSEEQLAGFNKQRDAVLASIGYDEAVFGILQSQVAPYLEKDEELPEPLRAAWQQLLARRDSYLELKIGFALDELGHADEMSSMVGEGYAEAVGLIAEEALADAHVELNRTLPILAAQQLLQLTVGSDKEAHEQAVARDFTQVEIAQQFEATQAAITQRLEVAHETALAAAAEREQLSEQRVELVALDVRSDASRLSPVVLVCMQLGETAFKLGMIVGGEGALQDENLTAYAQDVDFDDPEAVAKAAKESHGSLIVVEHESGLDPMELLATALYKYEELRAQLDESNAPEAAAASDAV